MNKMQTVRTFSDYIHMECGLDKCAKTVLKRLDKCYKTVLKRLDKCYKTVLKRLDKCAKTVLKRLDKCAKMVLKRLDKCAKMVLKRLDKCAMTVLKRGKLVHPQNLIPDIRTEIQDGEQGKPTSREGLKKVQININKRKKG